MRTMQRQGAGSQPLCVEEKLLHMQSHPHLQNQERKRAEEDCFCLLCVSYPHSHGPFRSETVRMGRGRMSWKNYRNHTCWQGEET